MTAGARLGRSLALPLLAVLIAYLVVGYSAGRPAGKAGDPSYFIHAGQNYLAPDLLPEDSFIDNENGYDGQFFFYIAQDLLLDGRAATRDQAQSDHIDNVPYRYQRILLPLAGWLTSAGDPDVLVWTLPLVNLLAVLGATFLLSRVLARHGRSPWIALGFALSLGVMVGVVNDLSDPLAASLLVAGVVWWLEGRTAPAVLALTAALLARELYVIPVVVIAAVELLRRPRSALPWFVPLGVLAAWQAYLRVALAAPPTDGAASPSLVPLLGAARKGGEVLNNDILGAANWELAFVGILLLTTLAFAVASAGPVARVIRERRIPSRAELVPVVALASLLLIPFLTQALWRNVPSYSRYAAPATGMLVLLHALRGTRWTAWLLAGFAALTVTNPVVAMLPTLHPFQVRPAPGAPTKPRADAVIDCLDGVGLVARTTTKAPAGATAIAVTMPSGELASIFVFLSAGEAARYQSAAGAFDRAAPGRPKATLVRRADLVATYRPDESPAGVAALRRCL